MSILALGKQKKKEKKKEKFPIKECEKAKKGKKIPDQGSEENRRNIQKGLWTRQYLNNTELSPSKQKKKGKHDLKWSSPFDCQPKSCALATFSPRTKQKNRKGKGKNTQSQIPHLKTIPKISPIDP